MSIEIYLAFGLGMMIGIIIGATVYHMGSK